MPGRQIRSTKSDRRGRQPDSDQPEGTRARWTTAISGRMACSTISPPSSRPRRRPSSRPAQARSIPRTKADQSPVTAADEAAEAVILDGLARVLPGVPVVSEEAAGRAPPARLGDRFILVDPLDGTRELLAGRDEFTVNVAIVSGGRPTLGIVAAPALGLLWRGARERGRRAAAAFARDRRPARPASAPPSGRGLVRPRASSPPSAARISTQDTQAFLARLPVGSTVTADRRSSSAGRGRRRRRLSALRADLRMGRRRRPRRARGRGRERDGAVGRAAGLRPDRRALQGPGFIAWGDRSGGRV